MDCFIKPLPLMSFPRIPLASLTVAIRQYTGGWKGFRMNYEFPFLTKWWVLKSYLLLLSENWMKQHFLTLLVWTFLKRSPCSCSVIPKAWSDDGGREVSDSVGADKWANLSFLPPWCIHEAENLWRLHLRTGSPVYEWWCTTTPYTEVLALNKR